MQSRQRQARGPVLAAVMLASLMVTGLSVTADATGKLTYASPSAVVFSEASCEGDWVEIQNTDPKYAANLANWFISDAMPADPASSFRFPKTKLLKPGARIVVKTPSLPFKLGCGSDRVFLARSKTAIVDQISVPNLADGFTWGLVNSLWKANLPTPAKPNQLAPIDSVVDRAAWIYDPMKSYGIQLTIDPTQLQALVAKPKAYVSAKFQMHGPDGALLPSTGALEVGVRVKGSIGTLTRASYGPNGLNIVDDKVSLKVKFNYSVKGQTFFGLRKLTLNSMVEDMSMTHETLAYKAFRDAGLWAPRTGFANVYINDSLRGLFLNLEPYDEISSSWHLPAFRHIYEGQTVLTGADPVWVNPDFHAKAIGTAFLVDEGDPQDMSDLKGLVTAMERSIASESGTSVYSGSAMSTDLSSRVNVDQLGAFLAIEKFINHFDGYSGSVPWAPNNFYLVSDMKGRFQFLPWGTDVTWRLVPGEEGLDATGNQPFDSATAVAFRICLRDDQCAASYRRTLASTVASTPQYRALAESLVATHAASRIADTVRRASELGTLSTLRWVQAFLSQQPESATAYLKTVVTGSIRWTPSSLKLAKGVALTTAQLNAYSDVLGTFTYSYALGTKLPVGKTTVTVTFTPSDPQLTAPQSTSRVFTVS
jgi:hypothetical protein